ncbi:hypothetical protein JNUCC1_00691 [Lentibacillus sp. JNUCC-1]|nr:hypothetical protein [Lentibacillus sp. JNUCC-1]MUV36887.1 hypothetical protein [Lentibacillus sp. JNUCC-1]
MIPFFFVGTFAGSIATSLGIGVGLAGVLVVLDILLADVVDEDAVKTGVRREGCSLALMVLSRVAVLRSRQ